MQFGWSVAKSAAATPLVTILSPPPSIKSCTIFAFATAWSGILYPFGLRWRFFLIFTSYVFVKEDEDSLFKRRTSFPRHRGQNSFSGLLFLKEVADQFMRAAASSTGLGSLSSASLSASELKHSKEDVKQPCPL